MTDTFLICLDPRTYQIYSIGLQSKLVVVEIDVPLKIRAKALKANKELERLKPTEGGHWWFGSSQSRVFRKRLIPKYFIHQDSHLYPRYFQFFDISLAFEKISMIEIEIDLTNYSHIKSETNTPCPDKLILAAPLATG